MKRLFLLLAIASAPASAAPTYLSCVAQQGQPLPVNIVADEQGQTATVELPSGRIVRRPAVFSPTEVRILDEETTWIVDRVKLGFQRVVSIGDHTSVYPGTCAVGKAPPQRAF